jgi:uncharacterized protein YciI
LKKFLVVLKDKRNRGLNRSLLDKHIEYLKKQSEEGTLRQCGPFANNKGAFMVFHCKAFEHVESAVNQDPFIMENYYQTYEINEFFEANDENNWLMTSSQTVENLN